MIPVRRSSCLRGRGFTIVEILVVICVMTIVMGMVVPATNSLLESYNLTQAGQTVADQIGMARQIASVSNRSVEVRMIKLPVGSGVCFRAVQIWMADKSGNMVAKDKMIELPLGVIFSEKDDLSPILQTPQAMPPMAYSGTMPSGGAAPNAPYLAFRIRPSGQVEPVPETAKRAKCFVTLLGAKYASATQAPANLVTIQLNPYTGSVQIYRP